MAQVATVGADVAHSVVIGRQRKTRLSKRCASGHACFRILLRTITEALNFGQAEPGETRALCKAFTLDWIKNPGLRRRAHLGLNKGEARNALARAVYFCRLGEMRDRSFENQFFRASGLNLLVAAIILWNTRYLEAAYRELRRQSRTVNEDLLRLRPLRQRQSLLVA